MTNEEQLITVLRQRLRIHLAQSAQLGINAPPHILIQIEEARTQIAALKIAARQRGYTIADQSIDADLPPTAPREAPPTPAVDRAAAVRARLHQIETLIREIEHLL